MRPLRGRLIAALAGAALPVAFAPFGWYLVAPLSLAVLFACWDTAPREAAWRGFCYGAAAFVAGTWWLYVSVRLVGGTPLPVAILLLGGLVAIMATWIAACGYLVARLATASLAFNACLLAPAGWVLVEWLRGWVLSGFPWLSIGYGQIDGPFAAWAPVGGVYAVTLATAILAGVLLALVRGGSADRVAAAVVVLLLSLVTSALVPRTWTKPEGEALRVSLVQGAIPQLLKWAPGERQATLERYATMTLGLHDEDLVIWPEAAIPLPDDLAGQFLADLSSLAQLREQQLLVGILTHDQQTDEYRNSLLALGKERGVYHKRHLVPFGEYFPVPQVVRGWMRMMNMPYDDIAAGEARQEPLRVRGVGLAPTICYEDAFGAEQLVFLPEAGMLVNVSNDAWFGDTIAPHQHLQMARMRALETGRWLLRSTNTGITALINERGKVVATAPQFEPYVLSGQARSFSGATPYVSVGNWPVLLLSAGAIGLAWRRRRSAAP
jgi:apolipoprotein N-acyltransferase